MMIDTTATIQLLGTLLGTALTGFIAYKMAQLKIAAEMASAQAAEAARKVDSVAINLKLSEVLAQQKLNHITETTEKTLVHVNDQFLIQLRLYMESTRIVAELRKNPVDVAKAEAAEKMYMDHEARQKQVREDRNATDAVHAAASAAIEKSVVKDITLEKLDSGTSPVEKTHQK